jgi:hypothetical protein
MSVTYRKNDGAVAERLVRGEVLLVPIRRDIAQMGRVFDLNGTATRIWDLAKEGLDETAIAAALAREYAVSDAEALPDVQAVLARLVEVGALVRQA